MTTEYLFKDGQKPKTLRALLAIELLDYRWFEDLTPVCQEEIRKQYGHFRPPEGLLWRCIGRRGLDAVDEWVCMNDG